MADVKEKTVRDDMPAKRYFDSVELAAAALKNDLTVYGDIGDLPVVSPVDSKRNAAGLALDDEGNFVFDAELFPAGMRVMISTLSTRVDGDKSKIKGIVVAPVPSFDAIIADDAGKAWLEKIVGTELQRIAVAGLRDRKVNGVLETTDIQSIEVLDAMPKTLADFVTSNRGGSSTLLQAFEDNWKSIKAALAQLSPAWKRANLSKREFKFGMSSHAYAYQYYPTIEENKAGSLFVMAIQAFTVEAEKTGADTSIFAQWLANRNDTVIDIDAEEDADEFDFSALAAALNKAPAEPAPVVAPAPANDEATADLPIG
jgi:hypothetical protein